MKIYISGPISGIPDGNRQTFLLSEIILRNLGHQPVNPHKLMHVEGDSWGSCMRRDITALMECDALAFLPGWENSRGSKIEIQLAQEVGMPVHDILILAGSLRNGA